METRIPVEMSAFWIMQVDVHQADDGDWKQNREQGPDSKGTNLSQSRDMFPFFLLQSLSLVTAHSDGFLLLSSF